MANTKTTTDGGCMLVSITATGQVVLGDGLRGAVSSFTLMFVGSGWTGSITIKARPTGSGLAATDGVEIPYQRRNVGGTVSDDTVVSGALTGDALIQVTADGLDIILDVTDASAGSMDVYAVPMRG